MAVCGIFPVGLPQIGPSKILDKDGTPVWENISVKIIDKIRFILAEAATDSVFFRAFAAFNQLMQTPGSRTSDFQLPDRGRNRNTASVRA